MKGKRTLEQYKQYGADILDRDVFRKLWFKDKETRDILYDSYMLSMEPLVEYAMAHQMRVRSYLNEIRNILLQSDYVHMKTYPKLRSRNHGKRTR